MHILAKQSILTVLEILNFNFLDWVISASLHRAHKLLYSLFVSSHKCYRARTSTIKRQKNLETCKLMTQYKWGKLRTEVNHRFIPWSSQIQLSLMSLILWNKCIMKETYKYNTNVLSSWAFVFTFFIHSIFNKIFAKVNYFCLQVIKTSYEIWV